MRTLAAILILSACTRLHAQPRGLDTIKNILDCGLTLGPSKCLSALTAWRADRAFNHPDVKTNLTDDLKQFPWKKYSNSTEEELYSEACDGAEKLLRRQTLSFTMIPGYKFELQSKGNGTLNLDVSKHVDSISGRSSIKKAQKTFFKIFPFLVMPGLIMSAILPFVLPALKFMTLGAGMLNNMALTSAVFTLLRNNAFNDRYEHKVIYVNKGYQNEKHGVVRNEENVNHFVHYEESSPSGFADAGYENIEEMPLNPNWIKQYYGDGSNVQILENRPLNRGDKDGPNDEFLENRPLKRKHKIGLDVQFFKNRPLKRGNKNGPNVQFLETMPLEREYKDDPNDQIQENNQVKEGENNDLNAKILDHRPFKSEKISKLKT